MTLSHCRAQDDLGAIGLIGQTEQKIREGVDSGAVGAESGSPDARRKKLSNGGAEREGASPAKSAASLDLETIVTIARKLSAPFQGMLAFALRPRCGEREY